TPTEQLNVDGDFDPVELSLGKWGQSPLAVDTSPHHLLRPVDVDQRVQHRQLPFGALVQKLHPGGAHSPARRSSTTLFSGGRISPMTCRAHRSSAAWRAGRYSDRL